MLPGRQGVIIAFYGPWEYAVTTDKVPGRKWTPHPTIRWVVVASDPK